MSKVLHITNGDSFTNKLKSLNIKGDIITWREMLCEGKTLSTVGTETFWKTRFEFLNKNYKISKSWFIEKTLKEYRSLCNHKQEDEIVLWFEHDLFCQVNMIAVLSWLKIHRKYAQITLVCSGKEDDSEVLYGLCDLNDAQLNDLYTNRTELSQDDIEYADYVWQLYCSDNPIRLQNLGKENDFSFNYLSDAVANHLKRFPTIKNGLNEMENSILDLADTNKFKTRTAFLTRILKTQKALGFGDTQYNRALDRLKPLFQSFNPVTLNQSGINILKNSTSYYSCIQDNDVYLGGALKYNFLYNTDNNRILKL